MTDPVHPEQLAHALERFSVELDATTLPAALRAELGLQAAPAIETLLLARSVGAREAYRPHEAGALVNLLGRRVAALGVAPVIACAVIEAVFDAVAARDERRAFTPIFFDGYLASHAESIGRRASAALLHACAIVSVAPRVIAAFLPGLSAVDDYDELPERIGRVALAADARAVLVVVCDASAGTARVLAAVESIAETLGARVVCVGHEPSLREAAAACGAPVPAFEFVPTFDEALRAARASARRTRLARLSLPFLHRFVQRTRRDRGP